MSQVTTHLDVKTVEEFVARIVGIVLCCGVITIGSGGGVGTFELLAPILMIFLRMSPVHSISLSCATLAGASLANLWINWRKRHTMANRPQISWELVFVLHPITTIGVVLGSFGALISGDWPLMLTCSVQTCFWTMKRIYTAIMYLKSRRASPSHSRDTPLSYGFHSQFYLVSPRYVWLYQGPPTGELVSPRFIDAQDAGFDDVLDVLEKESNHDFCKFSWMIVATAIILAPLVLKGTETWNPLQIDCYTTEHWLLTGSPLALCLIFWILHWWIAARQYRYKLRIHYEFVDGDVSWDDCCIFARTLLSCIGGVLGGFLGTEGILGAREVMLSYRADPAIVSSSANTLTLFISATATVSFALYDRLPSVYWEILFCLGLVFTFAGQMFFQMCFKQTSSIGRLLFVMCFVSVVVSVLMIVETIQTISLPGAYYLAQSPLC